MRYVLFFMLAVLGLQSQPASSQVLINGIPPTADLGQDYTVATLPPCDAGTSRRTAWVTDLMGLPQGDRAICDGGNWKPIRPLAVQVMTASSMTLYALTNAPTVVFTGAIAANVNITLSPVNAYRGAKSCIIRKATGVGSVVMTGLGTILALNSWVCYEFNGTSWEQTQSGGLL